MRYEMKLVSAFVIVTTVTLGSALALASSPGGDATALATLQAKAGQAPPRDRCFLYAELVGQLADRASQQLISGDAEQASKSLWLLREYAEEIDSAITTDSRKLKDAELLTRRASFRLSNLLRSASYDDRPALDATLKRLYKAQTNLMTEVFKR
jgi:hypothetical protein